MERRREEKGGRRRGKREEPWAIFFFLAQPPHPKIVPLFQAVPNNRGVAAGERVRETERYNDMIVLSWYQHSPNSCGTNMKTMIQDVVWALNAHDLFKSTYLIYSGFVLLPFTTIHDIHVESKIFDKSMDQLPITKISESVHIIRSANHVVVAYQK